jgi:hypothetical protein
MDQKEVIHRDPGISMVFPGIAKQSAGSTSGKRAGMGEGGRLICGGS